MSHTPDPPDPPQKSSIVGKAERTSWLAGLGALPSAYMGAMEPMQLLREARAYYVEGHFMAAILAAAAQKLPCKALGSTTAK